MKKYIFVLVAVLLTVSISCEDTNENLVQERGVAVVVEMSDVLPAFFTENIEASYVQFDAALSQGDQIDKAEIEVIRIRTVQGKEVQDKRGVVKTISLPETGFRVTASEIVTALNISASDFLAGDIFYLYLTTTKNGTLTRTKGVSIPVVCFFDPSMLVGDFYYESTSWGEAGDVFLEADPDDPYKIYVDGIPESQGLTGNGNKLVFIFDPNNFNVSGPRVIFADSLAEWDLPYTGHAYQPVSGKYDSCEKAYVITFAITVDQGGWGNFSFTFKKQ